LATNNPVIQLFDNPTQRKDPVACDSCSLYSLCLPLGLNNHDLQKLDQIIDREQRYQRNDRLFRADTPFTALFVVRSGTFKTTVAASNGREQITGFYFPGEFIGLDAIYTENYQSTATALETSTLCALPFTRLQTLGADIPQLQINMLRRSSKELASDKNLMILLSKNNADARLATFLLSLSARFQERGFSTTRFRLSMPRKDIANHLGLAVETISRLFARFQQQGLIDVAGKSITLVDLPNLQARCEH
jgi:CRP/FNR family transcriptional regulator